jgi:hypothetical protein
VIVNKRQLAEVFEVSDQAITEWDRNGMPVLARGERGLENQYNTAAVIEWRLQRALAGRQSKTLDDQIKSEELKQLQFKNAQAAGAVIAVENVGPVWEAAILAARTNLLTLGPRLKAEIQARHGVEIDAEVVNEFIRAALVRLSEQPPVYEDDEAAAPEGENETAPSDDVGPQDGAALEESATPEGIP